MVGRVRKKGLLIFGVVLLLVGGVFVFFGLSVLFGPERSFWPIALYNFLIALFFCVCAMESLFARREEHEVQA